MILCLTITISFDESIGWFVLVVSDFNKQFVIWRIPVENLICSKNNDVCSLFVLLKIDYEQAVFVFANTTIETITIVGKQLKNQKNNFLSKGVTKGSIFLAQCSIRNPYTSPRLTISNRPGKNMFFLESSMKCFALH